LTEERISFGEPGQDANDEITRRPMTISIRNLEAALGVEVSGIDLSKPVAQDDVNTRRCMV
jgi:hypothetical protein